MYVDRQKDECKSVTNAKRTHWDRIRKKLVLST